MFYSRILGLSKRLGFICYKYVEKLLTGMIFVGGFPRGPNLENESKEQEGFSVM